MDFKQYTEQLAFQKFGVTNVAEPFNISFFYDTAGTRFIVNDIQYLYVGTFYVSTNIDGVVGTDSSSVTFQISQTSQLSRIGLSNTTVLTANHSSKFANVNLIVFNQLFALNEIATLSGSFVGYRIQIA